jgi:putative transposase
MSDSFTNLLYHIVFSTKERRPLITLDYEPRLYEYIGGTLRGLGGVSLELNGTADHVHLLAKLRPDRALSDVLRKLKANASGWMHDVFPAVEDFSWQRGYGAFTVSESNVEEVRNYLRRQKEHHAKISFRDEFIQFLKQTASSMTNDTFEEGLSAAPRAYAPLLARVPGVSLRFTPGFMPASAPRTQEPPLQQPPKCH